MNTQSILQKSWQMVWHYRALWLFGAILALLAANTIFTGPWPDSEKDNQWIKVKISDYSTIRIPGVDMTIDLTSPGGIRVIKPDETAWREFRDQVDVLNNEASINLTPILIEFAVILAGLLLLGAIARYVAETAVICMVNETEETGRRLGLREGLRQGWSSRAWRLFLVDLAVGVLAALTFVLVFGLAFSPTLLTIGSPQVVVMTAAVGTLGLLILAFFGWLAASILLSLVMQPIRYACVLENRSLMASIQEGFRMTKVHLKEVGLMWLIWMGIRFLGAPLIILAVILLAPVLMLTLLAGVAVGSVPAALVAAISSLSMEGNTPWIMGALAGLPIFTVLTISPILFVSGLVEIYKVSLWTLAYRDLRSAPQPVQAPAPQPTLAPAHGTV